MRLLVELPDFIDETVLITPSIENLLKHFKNAEVTFIGTQVTCEFFKNDKRVSKILEKETTPNFFSLFSIFFMAKSIGKQDLVISYKNSFYTKFLQYFIKCKNKYIYDRVEDKIHEVEKYNAFINSILHTSYKAGDLMLRFKPQWFKKRTFGIHPGSTYANTKRWEASEFIKVAKALSSKYEIVLLGGKSEVDICEDIENELKNSGISCENLAGKTSVSDLIEKIAALDLFLTIDTGPMYIAAVYRVNSIIVPTSHEKIEFRNQWKNPLENIIYKIVDPHGKEVIEDYSPTSSDVLEIIKV
jgi:heptosyltransferase-2